MNRLKPGLKLFDESASASLKEGFEDALTLHCLGPFPYQGFSLKTINCIKLVMSLVEQYTHSGLLEKLLPESQIDCVSSS